jgi:hypothetical protein
VLLIAALVVTLAEPALRADTLKELHILAPPSSHGSLGGVIQWDTLLTKQQIVRLPFSGLSDCLSRLPQYLPVHFGETAAWHQLRFGAIPPRGVALELGARPWSDPVVGLISPELYPPEFVERIEAVWGSRAVVLGWNSAGALLNIVPVRWRAGRPYSRLWYLNAAYGTGGSDGGLSWNFHPRWGVHLGYRRVASEGRFPNGWANLWNVRSVLQWTPTPKLTVTLSELFTSWNGGLNGGIDVARTPQWWDELTAQVRFPQLNERLSRHDATVAMTFQQDSATTLNAQLWGVRAWWEQQHGEEFQPPEAGTVLPASGWSTLQMGLRLRGEHAAAPFALLAGVDLLWERIPKELAEGGWKGALYGLLRYATRGWEVYGGMRLLRHVGENGRRRRWWSSNCLGGAWVGHARYGAGCADRGAVGAGDRFGGGEDAAGTGAVGAWGDMAGGWRRDSAAFECRYCKFQHFPPTPPNPQQHHNRATPLEPHSMERAQLQR